MGFTAKQTHALRRNVDVGKSAPARPMAASFPISKAGSSSRKPIAFSDSMAGTGKRLNPAASSPAKTAAHSSPSISPGCASPCTPKEQPSFAKATVPVKAAAPPLAKSTISPSRQPKPTPPNERLATFGKPFGLELYRQSRTAAALPISQPMSGAIAPTRFGFHPDDTTPIPRPSKYYGRRQSLPITEHFKEPGRPANPRPRQRRRLHRQYRSPRRPRSTKAFSRWPNPNAAATNPICALSPHSPVLSADVIRRTRIICALRSQGPWAPKSAMSSRCRCAAVTIVNSIKLEMKSPGGRASTSTPYPLARQLWEQTHPNESQIETETKFARTKQRLKANGDRETNCCEPTKSQEEYGATNRIR